MDFRDKCGVERGAGDGPSNGVRAEGLVLPDGGAGLWTFAAVEERLVEAMACWRRAGDRERGWLHVKAWWPEGRPVVDPHVDYADGEAAPRALPLSRAEYARMMEASEWVAMMPAGHDGRTVEIVRHALWAKSFGGAPDWGAMKHRLGIRFGKDGLRRRYERAVGHVAAALNKGLRGRLWRAGSGDVGESPAFPGAARVNPECEFRTE